MFLALFGHLAENRQDLVLAHTFVVIAAARGNVLILDRGIDQAKRGQSCARFVLHDHFLGPWHGSTSLFPKLTCGTQRESLQLCCNSVKTTSSV